MITYTAERLIDNLERIKELAELHHKEVAPFDDIELCIDWKRFLNLEELGYFKLFVVRKDDILIGYANFTVGTSIEYSNMKHASLGNIFIEKQHRGIGGKFISWCEEVLKEYEVQVVYHHVKVKNDYGVLLKRLGYDMINISYAKRLDK